MVRIKCRVRQWHCPGSVAVAFMAAVPMVYGSVLTLIILVCSSACKFQFMGPVFLHFSQKFPNFSFQGLELALTS